MDVIESQPTGNRILMVRAISNMWMIEPEYANAAEQMILSMSAHELLEAKRETQSIIESSQDGNSYSNIDGIAYINMNGPMTKEYNSMMSMMGGCSTKETEILIKQALQDKDVKSIMLVIDSPGGTTDGSFDLAYTVYAANKVKPIDAYAEDCCASAAYLVASQCRNIYANTSAMIGSIGIITCLVDTTKANEMRGITKHYIVTGDHKPIGHDGVQVTDKHIAARQDIADKYMSLFVKAVSKGRLMDADAMSKVTNAKVFIGKDAKRVGLIDDVITKDDAHKNALQNIPNKLRGKKMSTETTATAEIDLEAISDVRRWLAPDEQHSATAEQTQEATAALVPTISAEHASLLAALENHGIKNTIQLDALVARAGIGEEYLARLRMQTCKLAVIAMGKDAGASAEGTINLLGVTELRAMARDYENLAVAKGLIPPLAGSPAQRISANGDHPQVGRDGNGQSAVADSSGTVQPNREEQIAASIDNLRNSTDIYHF